MQFPFFAFVILAAVSFDKDVFVGPVVSGRLSLTFDPIRVARLVERLEHIRDRRDESVGFFAADNAAATFAGIGDSIACSSKIDYLREELSRSSVFVQAFACTPVLTMRRTRVCGPVCMTGGSKVCILAFRMLGLSV